MPNFENIVDKMDSSPEQLFCLRWNNHQANIVEVFDQLLENESFTDVTLAVEGGYHVKCHKMVLAASSSYFQNLFTEFPGADPIVILGEVKHREIKELLEYMYTGQVKVAQADFPQLLRVACLLKVKGLMSDETMSSVSEFTKNKDEATSTSSSNNFGQHYESSTIPEKSSPPHSTSSTYYGYHESPTKQQSHGLSIPHHRMSAHSSSGQISSADLAALQSSLNSRHPSSYIPSSYESTVETPIINNRRKKMSVTSKTMRNHDTPILRNVLGQGHVDNSQLSYNQPDGHEYRSHSNESAQNENDDRRSSTETPNCPSVHSSYGKDTSMVEGDDKKASPASFAGNAKSGTGKYVSSQKPEWKHYKQYERADLANAINAVKEGISALAAARKYGVPSRTLYDKVKKLGITTSRPFRRSSKSSGACFPYGLGANVHGNIYGTVTENKNENSANVPPDNPATLLETTFVESQHDNSMEQDGTMEIARNSPSLEQLPPYLSHRSMSTEDIPKRETTNEAQEIQDQVEDLSVSRRTEVGVIVSPGVAIKEEK